MPLIRRPPTTPPPPPRDAAGDANVVSVVSGGGPKVDSANDERRAPEDVYASHDPKIVSPSHALKGSFLGYKFDPKDVDAVMKKHGLGDVKALLRVAISLHRAGERFLTKGELERAAKEAVTYTRGVHFSPVVVADVMKQTGIAEQGALIRAARKLDDGDKNLSREELEAAAALLKSIVNAHDVDQVIARVNAVAREGAALGVTVQKIGEAGGNPIQAVTIPSTVKPPKMRVLVTGGVHGNEPCGTGAAMLLMEQALRNPKMREEIEIVVIPLVNPRGLREGTRRTPENVDLNRTFHDEHGHAPHETNAVRDYLLAETGRKGAFDVALDLHSGKADRNGFWILHDDAEDQAAFAMKRFAQTFPALSEDADPYTLTSPGVAMSNNEGTLKSFAKDAGTPLSFTIEAPGSVAYLDQVLGEAELVLHLIDAARR